ncbi:MAG: ribonuclease R [Gammaproteobacteria bacterium]|nr:ribonuclease R [Gammaproteobacteria bacterium]
MSEKNTKKTETKTKVGAKVKAMAKSIVKSMSRSKTKVKARVKTEVVSEVKIEAKTRTKTRAKTAVQAEVKTEVKAKAKTKSKAKSKPKPKAKTGEKTKEGTREKAKPKSRSRRGRGGKSGSQSEDKPKARSRGAKRGPIVDPEAQKEASKYENPIASRHLLLQLIRDQNAMTLPELIEHLKMETDDEQEALRRRLRAMVRDGQLVQNRRGGYLSVEEDDLIRGRVIAHPDGFGFLVPEESGDDLFLNAREMRTLMHGDRAVVKVAGIDRRGRREGAVISIIERSHQFVVGRLFDESGIYFVVPDNKRLTQNILIPAKDVGDAQPDQIVKVEILQYPTFKREAIGRVESVIGDLSAPGMEIEIAIHNHGLPHEWTDAVIAEAAKLGPEVREEDKQGRVDLRSVPLVTIDGADARDFDDAVYCEPVNGGWRLLVAIADVAHYVKPGSALDISAYDRATSVYFPGRVIPMLPEEISNGLCSLNPEVDRLCMVCEMRIDEHGEIAKHKFYEAVFRSHARLLYDEVADVVVEKSEAVRTRLGSLVPHLEDLYALYGAFMKARRKRGSIEFDSTETKIDFTDDKRIASIKPFIRNDAHRIIEECMIAANVSAAETILKHELPALYRDHDRPDDDKIEDLRGFLSELGLTLGDPQKKIASLDYSVLTEALKAREDKHLVQTLLLRSLKQAVYKAENTGHFGLALAAYAHFTSPIRRYPDLLVHRALKHIIHKQKKKDYIYDQTQMASMGEHCSNNERRADEATRDAEFALKCEYMLDKIGQEFTAHVTAVVSFGLFVELDDYYVEGLIHITSLPKDYYQFDPIQHRLLGENRGMEFRLCDPVTVRVTNVDRGERRIDFELVKNTQGVSVE